MTPEFLTMPIADYLSDPAPAPSLTRSLIVTLLDESPYHAWYQHPRLNPDRQDDAANKAMDIGSAAHAMLLEGRESFEVIDAPDYRTKAAQELRDAAREAGRHPLLAHVHQDVMAMVKAGKKQLERFGVDISMGNPEKTIIWQSGCWLRTRTDWVSDECELVIEYKTTDSTPAQWKRNLYAKGYDIQEAMHRAGVAAVTGEAPRVIFAVQNVKPPYSMFFVELSSLYREIAHRKIARAADIWQKCIEAGQWPDYGNEPEVIDPANWQIAAEEERDLAHEGFSVEAFLFGNVKEQSK